MGSPCGITLENRGSSLCVRVSMKIRKRGGRKEVIAPEGLREFTSPGRTTYQEALVIALARAHMWNEMLESSEYGSVTELANAIRIDRSYVARLLRFTLLAPDIVEAIVDGREPGGFSIHKLTETIPADWEEQRGKYGFAPTGKPESQVTDACA